MKNIKEKIETIFQKKTDQKNYEFSKEEKKTIDLVIKDLNQGKIRVSEKKNNSWKTNHWIKKSVLLYLYSEKNKIFKSSFHTFFDKTPEKYQNYEKQDFINDKIRVSSGSIVRYGSYIENNVILMPSFVNIGAYIGENTLIDTWATVGSCAQIGKNVHISGGAGIGGVLEPLQSNPTIIEDNCFIGARSEIVEGVIVQKGSVISMGVFIGQSTKIFDRTTNKILYGKIPRGSVVVSGSMPSSNKNHHLYCAVIVKKVDSKTLKKTQINTMLREKK